MKRILVLLILSTLLTGVVYAATPTVTQTVTQTVTSMVTSTITPTMTATMTYSQWQATYKELTGMSTGQLTGGKVVFTSTANTAGMKALEDAKGDYVKARATVTAIKVIEAIKEEEIIK